MRMLARITIPVEAGNKAIQDGSLPETMQNVLAALEPEAAYFFPQEGKRGGFVVFDLKDPSQIPSITEPLFQRLNATVEFTPVMNESDLRAGLSRLKQT
jgi:hypothetical protein